MFIFSIVLIAILYCVGISVIDFLIYKYGGFDDDEIYM